MYSNLNLGELFEKVANKNKHKIALNFLDGSQVSFNELNEKSDLFYNWIKQNRASINDPICILSNKNKLVFFVLIGCLKAGNPYTVLDKDNPDKRNLKVIKTLNPKLIFSAIKYKGAISKLRNFISLSKVKIISKRKKSQFKKKKFSLNTLAYNMFTSGSTGDPKGVSISHKNVLNFIDWSKNEYKIKQKDVFSNLNGLHFDNSIFDIFGGLFNGVTIVPVNKEDLLDPKEFFRLSKKINITTWFSVPSLLIYFMNFNGVTKNNFKSYKRIIFGGEAFPKKNLKKLFKNLGKSLNIFNVYGPTECTCICSSYKISNFDFTKNEMRKYAPLGTRMIKKFKYYILDKNKKVKIGNKGELFLSGENVGIGYYNNLQETKKRFILNPLRKKKELIYKTGDVVYQDKKTKLIYFVSRSDNQIKHMGHRIELDEIEKAINSLKDISRSLVTFGKKNNIGEITGWVSSYKNQENKIKHELSKILPNYMIPTKINYLKKIPINSNGKIDRRKITSKYYD